MILVYITAKDKAEASKIAHALLEKKLIACANIIDSVTSIYEWGGRLCEDSEVIAILKSKDDLFEMIKEEILAIHSYENPAIVRINADDASDKFSKWIEAQTSI